MKTKKENLDLTFILSNSIIKPCIQNKLQLQLFNSGPPIVLDSIEINSSNAFVTFDASQVSAIGKNESITISVTILTQLRDSADLVVIAYGNSADRKDSFVKRDTLWLNIRKSNITIGTDSSLREFLLIF